MEKIFSEHFPVLNTYTYLDTASSGLLAQPILNWRRELDQKFMEQASVFRANHKEHIEGVRTTMANFLKVTPQEVALVPNFSFGFNTLLERLSKKQKIILLEGDYPSINRPVLQKGFDVCYAKINECLEQNIVEAIKLHKPDVFAFSVVQYINGIKIDFDFLKKIKKANPNLLIVADGTQYLGTERFHLADSAIDIIGASTYKWMSAGYGNGVFIVKKEIHDIIFPTVFGSNRSQTFNTPLEESLLIKYFEPGHLDTLNYGSLEKAIQMLESVGMNYITNQNRKLARLAKKVFTEMGLLEQAVVNRDSHSTIFNIQGTLATFKKLRSHNIICSLRGSGIRVSFHFYNTKQDLNKLVSVLQS